MARNENLINALKKICGNWKRFLVDVSEVIDSFRVIPRILLMAVAYLVWDVVNWFKEIDSPTTQHTFLVTAVIGIIPLVIGLYQNAKVRDIEKD